MTAIGNKLALALGGVVIAATLNGWPLQARAQYPEKPISIVIPYPAGGVTDLVARALADSMSKHLGRPVVPVNRPGAGATIGGNVVATATPDGYTLGFFPTAAASPEVFRFQYSAPYQTTDLKAVSSVAGTAMSFAVRADSPLKSMKDVVELARKSNGLLIGTPGQQTLPSMIMVLMGKKENVKLEDAAFGGDAKTLPALLGGHVQVAAIDYSAMRPSVEAGKIRVLAVCTPSRVDFLPNVPTVLELGYQLPYVSALGVFGPKALPADVVNRLDATVARIVKEPAFTDRMRTLAVQPLYMDSATYQKVVIKNRDDLESFFRQQGLYK
jgi:tripartite-type tricarboxylate transporter receptor subunit TctC